jgi:hypothetical protein
MKKGSYIGGSTVVRIQDAVVPVLRPRLPHEAAALERGIEEMFEQDPEREWRNHIEVVAAKLAESEGA